MYCMYLCVVAKHIFPDQSVCNLDTIEDFLVHGNSRYDDVVKAYDSTLNKTMKFSICTQNSLHTIIVHG